MKTSFLLLLLASSLFLQSCIRDNASNNDTINCSLFIGEFDYMCESIKPPSAVFQGKGTLKITVTGKDNIPPFKQKNVWTKATWDIAIVTPENGTQVSHLILQTIHAKIMAVSILTYPKMMPTP